MFDYDDITQEDKKFVRDLIDRTTFNGNEQIYVGIKDPDMVVFDEGIDIDEWIKNEDEQMVIEDEKNENAAEESEIGKEVMVKVLFIKLPKKKKNLRWKSKRKDKWI